MSRTFPRAAGAMPAKLVSRMVRMPGAAGTGIPRRKSGEFIADGAAAKAARGGFFWKLFSRMRHVAVCEQKSAAALGRGRGKPLLARRRVVAFPAHADELRNARLLHGHAVKDAARFHGLAIVRDDDELCLGA